MRKMLVLFGALMLSAAPAAAQQSGPSAPADVAPAAQMENTAPASTRSLFPTTDEVKAQVSANEQARGQHGAVTTQRDFLYLVAAIAIGIIIAAVVLD